MIAGFTKCMAGASRIFYRTFHDHDARISIKTKQSREYFCIEFRESSPIIFTTGTLTDGNMEISSRK